MPELDVCPVEELPSCSVRIVYAGSLAVGVYKLLGFYGFGRVDLMLEDSTGELQVLEANAIPGLTETSLLPQAAEAAGIDFDSLVGRILELALERGRPAARV